MDDDAKVEGAMPPGIGPARTSASPPPFVSSVVGPDVPIPVPDIDAKTGDSEFGTMMPAKAYLWGVVPAGDTTKGQERVHSPEELKLQGTPVAMVLGPMHSAIVTEDRVLYTWGCGTDGQLGHGDRLSCPSPRPVVALRACTVVAVSLGEAHCGAITDYGVLYMWGDNAYGRLGLGDTHRRLEPIAVKALATVDVVQVCLGRMHSACITVEGTLLTWGAGGYGRLGHGNSDQKHVPTVIKVFEQERLLIRDVSLAGVRTAAVSQSGKLYIWGRVKPESQDDWHRPSLVEMPEPAHAVAISDHHGLVTTPEGSLYSWGKGRVGTLGHGDEKDRDTPTLVEALRGGNVVNIAINQTNSFAVLESGKAFGWGYDRYGLLGLGDEDKTLKRPVLIPRHLTSLSGRQVSMITAGAQHYGAVVTKQAFGTKPVFLRDLPEEHKCGMLTSLELTVEASGEPAPRLQWFLDNRPFAHFDAPPIDGVVAADNAAAASGAGKSQVPAALSGDQEVRLSAKEPNRTNVSTAFINKVKREHAGVWTCKAENRCGSTRTTRCIVRILELQEWVEYTEAQAVGAESDEAAAVQALHNAKDGPTMRLLSAKEEAAVDVADLEAELEDWEAAKEEADKAVDLAVEVAERRAKEENSQLKYCRYARTVKAKQGMAMVIQLHQQAWVTAAEKQEEAEQASKSLAECKKKVKQARLHLENCRRKALEPEENLRDARAALKTSRARQTATAEAMTQARKVHVTANQRMDGAVSTGSSAAVMQQMMRDGHLNCQTVTAKAMRSLLAKAVHSRPDLQEVENIPQVHDAAMHIIDKWRDVVPPPPGTAAGSHGTVAAVESLRYAQQLVKLLEASKAIAVAESEADPMAVVGTMSDPELALVPSIFETAVLMLSKYPTFRSAAMLENEDIAQILSLLHFAERVDVRKPVQEHLNRALETYGMLQWVFEKGLRSVAGKLLDEHLVKLQYVQEYLTTATLIKWGLPEDEAIKAMADVSTISRDSRSQPPADASSVADMLRRAAEHVPLQTLAHVFSETLRIPVGGGAGNNNSAAPLPPGMMPPIRSWSVAHVAGWLTSDLDLGDYADAFTRARIDGQMLLSLSEDDLIDLDVQNRFHRRLIILRRNSSD